MVAFSVIGHIIDAVIDAQLAGIDSGDTFTRLCNLAKVIIVDFSPVRPIWRIYECTQSGGRFAQYAEAHRAVTNKVHQRRLTSMVMTSDPQATETGADERSSTSDKADTITTNGFPCHRTVASWTDVVFLAGVLRGEPMRKCGYRNS